MLRLRLFLLVLLAGCADFELAERVHAQDQPPKVASLSAASTGVDGGLAGFAGDPLVISGERLDRVTVRIGGAPVRVLDTADGGTRLVVEVPDLGKPAASEVEVVAQGSTVFSEKHPLQFLGPGQVRTVRAGTQESLRVPTRAFGDLRVHVPPSCAAPDAGTLPCQDLPAVEEAARQVVLATGSSDFALPLALDFNLASAALEAPSALLAATGLVLPFRLPVVSERLFPVVVVALDERGALHAATTVLFQLADDSGSLLAGGALQRLSLPSTSGHPLSAQLVLLPAATPGDEVGRLVSLVMFQPAEGPALWALSSAVLRWTGSGAAFDDKPQLSLLAPRGQPQLVKTRTGVMLAGAVRLGADDKPEAGGSALSQVVFTPLGWNLVPVRFSEKGVPRSLEETVGAGSDLELWSAALHPEGGWLVVSVQDPATTAPRLLLAKRAGPLFELRSTAISLTAVIGFGFSPQGDPPALFGLEGLSGRVVRLDPDRLLPTAGYQVPGLTSATDLAGVGTSSEGRYLLIGDASGTVHRFSTESATFLPPLVSERKYGSFLVLSESSPTIRLAMSEGLDREGGAAGQVTLSVSGEGTVALGGGRQATAAVELPVLDEKKQRLRLAVASPGLEREHCGEAAPCAKDGLVQPECVQHQCRAPGELRITAVLADETFESTRCALGTMIRGMATRADGEVVVATSKPAEGTAGPVSLYRLDSFPETCERAQEVFAEPPAVTLTPAAGSPCGPGRCEGPLPVAVLPDGREVLILDGALGVHVVDQAKATAVAPPVAESGFVPVALAADLRPCRPGFVPVLAVAWRFLDGWGGTVTVHPPRTPSAGRSPPAR